MKKYELKTVEKNIATSTICNKCGKEFLHDEDGHHDGQVEHFVVRYGWGSFLDMIVFKFDLCDSCFNEFKNSFVIEPETAQSSLEIF